MRLRAQPHLMPRPLLDAPRIQAAFDVVDLTIAIGLINVYNRLDIGFRKTLVKLPDR